MSVTDLIQENPLIAAEAIKQQIRAGNPPNYTVDLTQDSRSGNFDFYRSDQQLAWSGLISSPSGETNAQAFYDLFTEV